MTSPRSVFRLNLLLGALGLLSVSTLFARAVSGLSFRAPSPEVLARACRMLLPHVEAAGVLALSAGVFGLVVALRGGRSARRQALQQRRFLASLGPVEKGRVARVPVHVFEASERAAFCAGLLRPRIFLSSAAVAELSASQLRAVVAHEAHHQRRRDPLRLYVSRVLADALFFLPALGRGYHRLAGAAEISADRAAAASAGGREPLASALLALGERRHGGLPAVWIAPERVDRLAGRPVRWRASQRLASASVVSIAALVALTAAWLGLSTSAQLNLPLLAAQSCMATMVAAPLFVAVALVHWMSTRVRRPPS